MGQMNTKDKLLGILAALFLILLMTAPIIVTKCGWQSKIDCYR
jgi:hypothetical protein